jgi:hypothetical protein
MSSPESEDVQLAFNWDISVIHAPWRARPERMKMVVRRWRESPGTDAISAAALVDVEVCLSQSHRSGSESVHIGGAPAVGFGFL